MIQEPEGPTNPPSTRDSNEDTIELALTGEQELALSRAAASGLTTARIEESGPALSVPDYENFTSGRSARIDLLGNVCFAMAVLGLAVVFVWPASDQHPPAPAIASPAPVAEATSAESAGPQGEPLRIKNAFDATEVFEFPSGTAESEAREAVAALLLSRARERSAEGPVLRQAGKPGRGATVQRREVFVTRLLVPAKEPWNPPN